MSALKAIDSSRMGGGVVSDDDGSTIFDAFIPMLDDGGMDGKLFSEEQLRVAVDDLYLLLKLL